MIIGLLHPGSGLGNQLFRYVMVRVKALDNKDDFGFVGIPNFKGRAFMELDFGKLINLKHHIEQPAGKIVIDGDNQSVIDDEFQAESLWGHRLKEIRQWLKTEPMEMPDDLCVINFRGGEYSQVPDFYLTPDYWSLAISEMKAKGINKFIVVTDDIKEAKKFFPSFDITHEIGRDWRSIRYAKHLILSNSSFAILPALLNEHVKEVLAPKFWGGRNIGQWRWPMNQYAKFTYL